MSEARFGQLIRETQVRDLKKAFTEVEAVIVFSLSKVPTRKINQLRQNLNGQSSDLLVIKNSLAKVAFKDLGWTDLGKELVGTCGISPVRGDITAVSKLLSTFSKDQEGFVLKGGILQGAYLASGDIISLGRLPSRETLLGQFAGVVQAPIRNLAVVLNAPIRSLALLMKGLSQKKEKQAS